MTTLSRRTTEQQIAITNNLATTGVIHSGGASGIRLHFPAGFTSTSLAVWEFSPKVDNNPANSANYTDSGVTINAAADSIAPVDDVHFAASNLKLVGNADDSATPVWAILKG